MNRIHTLLFLILTFQIQAQTVADFENFNIQPDTFLNNASPEQGFSSGSVFLPNMYNAEFEAWSGWAISSKKDTLTPGFLNQYSAITGSGFDDSQNYVVTFAGFGSTIHLGNSAKGMYVTNSTYAYRSILDGDAFAKKFGGETGDDPDFFQLTIKKYLDGALAADSIVFFLADYRFEDNTKDYIINDWTYIDLESIGDADSLSFSLSSSDNGQFGMNTPAYFCMDNFTTNLSTAVNSVSKNLAVDLYPNPVSEKLIIKWNETESGSVRITDLLGRSLVRKEISPGKNTIDLQQLPIGIYAVEFVFGDRRMGEIIVKK